MSKNYEFDYWRNQYCTGYTWSFLWGKFTLEYEFSETPIPSNRIPSVYTQWGGDFLYEKCFSWFGRSVCVRCIPLYNL